MSHVGDSKGICGPRNLDAIETEKSARQSLHLQSDSRAALMIFKSFLGAGILFLPHSFRTGGVLFSSLVLPVIALLSLESMNLLVQVQKHFCSDETVAIDIASHKNESDFAALGSRVITKKYGTVAGKATRYAVDTCLCLSQFGFCCTTFIFFAANLRSVLMEAHLVAPDFALWPLIAVQLLFYIPVALLKHLSWLSPLAIVADLCIAFGLGAVFYFAAASLHAGHVTQTLPASVAYFNTRGWPMLLGTAVFAFEGIGLVLPLRTSMQRPKKFTPLLSLTIAVVTLLMLLVAVLCCVAYGENVGVIIFDSFAARTRAQRSLKWAVQLTYSAAMLFTVPLTMFPALTIVEKYTFAVGWKRNVQRVLIPAVLAAISIACGQSLDILVSAIGSLCCGPLMFIFPAMFHGVAVAKTNFARTKDIAIVCVGVIVTLFVSGLTIYQWVA